MEEMVMELYAVQRDTLDGLYVFASESQRDRYAALFEDAEVGTVTVIDVDKGESMIREEGGEALSTAESIHQLEAVASRRYVLQYRDAADLHRWEQVNSFDRPGEALAARDSELEDEPDGLPKGRHRVVDMGTGRILEWTTAEVDVI